MNLTFSFCHSARKKTPAIRLLILLLAAGILETTALPACATHVPDISRREAVVLLHGLGRGPRSMNRIAHRLTQAGFAVTNPGYPSRKKPVSEISAGRLAQTVTAIKKQYPGAPIHFVTHSMGGILLRHYLQTHRLPKGSRIVMLSPPNHGSQVADRLKNTRVFKWFGGCNGRRLTTDSNSLPNRLAPVSETIGVITGDRSIEPWFSYWLPGRDDGKVTVESARLAEMSDFLVVHQAHGLIMCDRRVLDQIVFFLDTGRFQHDPDKHQKSKNY